MWKEKTSQHEADSAGGTISVLFHTGDDRTGARPVGS